MVKNVKIGKKLTGAFLIMATIAAVIGIYGYCTLSKIEVQVKDIGTNRLSSIQSLLNIKSALNMIWVGERGLINRRMMASDIRREQYAYIDDGWKLLDENMKIYEPLHQTEEESRLWQEYLSGFDNWKKLHQKARMLSEEKDRLVASGLDLKDKRIVQLDEEAFAADMEARRLLLTTFEVLNKVVDLNSVYAGNSYSTTMAMSDQGKILLLVVMGCGIVFALFLGFLISRGITEPVNRLKHMIEEMGKGHLSLRLKMDSIDEIGMMAKTMDQFADDLQTVVVGAMKKIAEGDLSAEVACKDNDDEIAPALKNTIESLRGLVVEANMLSKAAVEGKLDTRGAVDKFKGVYREIVAGVNDTLDAVIGPLNVAAEYVDRISKGDIPGKITDNYNGDFNEIKNNLNQCIDAVNAMSADALMLSRAAVEGKLETRADASKHHGDFRKIVQGVNNTIESIVGLLNVMPAPAMIVDKEYTVHYMNNIGAEVIGLPAKQIIGTKCYSHFKTSDCNTAKCAVCRCMQDGRPATSETDAHPGGNNLEISYTGVPVKDEKGAIIGAFEIVTDQTAIKKAARISQKVSQYQEVEVNKLNSCLTRMAQGDLAFTVDVSEGDGDTSEVRKNFLLISNAINECTKAINALCNDAAALSNAAVEGKLDTRADATKHMGDFRKIVQGVNDTLDSVIGPLNVAARYVDLISKGDIPAKITDSYNGDFNTIKNNLNQCIEAVNMLVADANMLSEAAVDGRLDTRADASRHQGDFRKIVQGVNDTLDAVLDPIKEATIVLEKVAERDLTARVKSSYKGDHTKIKDAINTAVENLDSSLQQVNIASDQVASASAQIGTGSQALAQGASEQASSLEEISSSLQEMASMTKQNTGNAIEAKSMTESTKQGTMRGVESMNRLSEAINAIKSSSDQTAKIVKTIDEIAFQTNLLALNAAVEAARAGEAGKGFAVVAEEVRNLAMRSAEAAKNTANLIEESSKNADNGVAFNQEVLKNLNEINSEVNKVSEMMAEIAAGSEQQSTGIDQINTAVDQMNQLTQHNAANSEESASAAQELGSQAQEMRQMVETFMLSSKGTKTYAAARREQSFQNAPRVTAGTVAGKAKSPGGNGNGNGHKHTSLTGKAGQILPLDDIDLKSLENF
ncbi:MAG: methyl-accepting chemotaxis protein [Vulcanimicrobiota bacterium]